MSENRKPRPLKPKDDLSALFPGNKEHEKAFLQWARDNTERTKFFNAQSDGIKTLLYAISEFWYDRVNEGWKDTIDLLSEQNELVEKLQAEIPEALKFGKMAAILEHWDAIQAKQKRLVTLATKARPEAIKKRREVAKANNAMLDKAISDLFARPESKGWRWTNNEIADYVAEHIPIYEYSTIFQRVKTLAAKHRKDGK